ncbi:siderophore-interacting protein [Deinococcus cellulosilyticus]|uniref:Siderophore-interacting protein n=1 Tax=Deinococcus cellulosilyticus (strain DSM 18568 / NBRC 106333 / KACC 11606 / 5516J-15) TaxID=1223518 RepID=A0A511MWN1_DEIC1|nr:siderophore-interacting protein [Deinococcus cellulosilyticus]GEM44678.1 siderophore-interacting protein [Deinococcus cellulosilyticus NBRC 106333 = KACC 11606]
MKRLWDMRVAEVRRVVHLTPKMRRITLGGPELENFHSGTHLKVLIPPAGVTPQWPMQDDAGKAVWPEGPSRPAMRTYTLRAYRPEAAEIDIDFVLHGKGIASQWAECARGGEVVGIIPPGKGSTYVQPAQHHLIAGDHCTVPAVSVILEGLPETATAEVFMLLPDLQELPVLLTHAQVKTHWLFEDQGESQQHLIQRVLEASWPNHEKTFVWVGGESQLVRTVRQHALQERGLHPSMLYALGYWKAGMTETRYSTELGYDFRT